MKIRSGLVVPKAGMKHLHRNSIQGLELIAQESLMKPDSLQQPFRRSELFFPQRRQQADARPPLSVEVTGYVGHLAIAFQVWPSQSQVRRWTI